jgi:hypothetical protein
MVIRTEIANNGNTIVDIAPVNREPSERTRSNSVSER